MNKIAVESDVRKERSSFVNGTNDREAYPKRWVAALVHTNCEKKVAKRLEDLGIVNYVPTQKEVHNWSDRRKVIHRVVIPSIVFVRISQDAEDELRRLSYIRSIIKNPGAKEIATPIPDEQIETLRFLLQKAEHSVKFTDKVNIGDTVEVIRGPLRGLVGFCCGVNNTELAIRLELLGYAITRISKNDVIMI